MFNREIRYGNEFSISIYKKYSDSMVRSSRRLIDSYDLQKIFGFNNPVKQILDRFMRFAKNISIQWSDRADT